MQRKPLQCVLGPTPVVAIGWKQLGRICWRGQRSPHGPLFFSTSSLRSQHPPSPTALKAAAVAASPAHPVPITPDPQKTLQPFCRSFGSKGNEDSLCTPCLFYTRMVCNDGLNCRFCHLQHKPRKRSKKCERHTENTLRPGNLNPLVDHQTIHPIRTRHGTRLPPRMWCRSRVARDLLG